MTSSYYLYNGLVIIIIVNMRWLIGRNSLTPRTLHLTIYTTILSVTSSWLPTPRFTSYASHTTHLAQPFTFDASNPTPHVIPLTFYASNPTPHLIRLTFYASNPTSHLTRLAFNAFSPTALPPYLTSHASRPKPVALKIYSPRLTPHNASCPSPRLPLEVLFSFTH